MKPFTLAVGVTAFAIAIATGSATAQQTQQRQGTQPFTVGNPLGLPVTSAADGAFKPMSSTVKVYGAIYSAESCSYDPVRNLIVVPNRMCQFTVSDHRGPSCVRARRRGLRRAVMLLTDSANVSYPQR